MRLSSFCVPSLALVAGLAPAMDWPGIDIHGFVSQGYLQSTQNNWVADTTAGTFAYNEIGLNVSSQVTDKLRVGAQLFAYDLGQYGNDQVKIDWAFGDYHHSDLIGIRLGRYKLPLGLYNEVLDLDLAFTSVLLPQAVYDARYRDILSGMNGAQLYGTLPMGGAGDLDYQLYVGTTNIDNDSYLATQFTALEPGFDTVSNITVGTCYGGQLSWRTPIEGSRLLAALMQANDLSGTGTILQATGLMPPAPSAVSLPAMASADHIYILTVGADYVIDQWTFASEYRMTKGDIDIEVDASALGFGTINAENEVNSDGGYIMASYRLDDHWEFGSYYGAYFGNRNNRDGNGLADPSRTYQKDFALTTRYDINQYWTCKLEGHYIDGTGMLSRSDNPDGFAQHWFLFAAKTTVNF